MTTCDRWQAAVSARLDGEDPGVAPSGLRAHLDQCSRCSTFAMRIHGLDTVAVLPPTVGPDRSVEILAAIRAEEESRASRTTPAPSLVPRIALGLAGVVQLLMSVPYLWSLADGPRRA